MDRRHSLPLIGLAILLAGACGDDDTAAEPSASSAGSVSASTSGAQPTAADTVPGGCEATAPGTQIDFGTYASSGLLDPTLVAGAIIGGHELAAVYDVLFTYDHGTDTVVPRLAESMTPSQDYTRWTLRLREEITFSDGTPLTAQLVADNIDRYFADTATSPAAGLLRPIMTKRVVDERTLEFTLEKPWFEFPKVFADQPGMIVNTAAIGDDPEAFAAQPPPEAGLGPYVVERNAPGEEIVMVARDDYWDGPVCVERVRFVSVPGARATYDAFQAGELDVAFLREEVVIAEAEADGTEGVFDTAHGGQILFLNHAEGRPANDPRIREAIWLAVDDQVVNDRVFQGTMLNSKSLIYPDSPLGSDAIAVVPTDPERAAALVEDAKADGYDGTLDIVCPTTPPSPDSAVTFQGLLEAVGFDVNVTTIPANEHVGSVLATNFDAACWGIGVHSTWIPSTLYRSLHSTGVNAAASSYRSDEMDRALDAALAADNRQAQQAAVAEVNNIFANDFVGASIGAARQGLIWQPAVNGVVGSVTSIALLHDTYVAE
jgi:peptide/nickel transport system substrate-binding protein